MNTELLSIDKILDKLHISELNEMQIDVARTMSISNDDILVLAPTGSGKTLAYLLPTIFKIVPQSTSPQVVVLVPTRELARQSLDVLKSMRTTVRGLALYGGRSAMDEHREIQRTEPHIIFATPGRLNDHLAKSNINPEYVRILIIDEFDKCLEMGFCDEMEKVVKSLPSVERSILLSATNCKEIPRFLELGHTQCIDYTAKKSSLTVDDRIKCFFVRSEQKDKLDTLFKLLCSFGSSRSIVFLNYRDGVERTFAYLKEKGFVASIYHGGLEQRAREDNLYKFSNGSSTILISTDIASRGLDIPNVDNIIHYHLPQGNAEYTHRVGRTARWDAEGRTFLLIGPNEQVPEYIDSEPIEYHLPADNLSVPTPSMATIYIGKGKNNKISKGDVMGFLCKKCGLHGDEIGRIDVSARFCYVAIKRNKLNSVLQQASGEKIKGVRTVFEQVF